MKTVYLETTIPSYLAARPARDVLQAARQMITHDWWDKAGELYALRISEVVLQEVAAGDPLIAETRLELLGGIPLLGATDEAFQLSEHIMKSRVLP